MKHSTTITPLLLISFAVVVYAQNAGPEKELTEPSTEATLGAKEDAEAVQRAIDSYIEAFNEADAKKLASHWTERGQFITPAGDTLRGRTQLEESFVAFFKESENAKIELVGTAIDFLSPSVAIETGTARVLVPEQEPQETEYEAIHVKTAEGWRIDSVREQEASAPPPSHYEQLKDMEWMVGTWVDADDNSTIETNCRWTTNRNFLVRSFKVFIQDRVDFAGTQIIGWDPHAQVIRSWMFDSDGGFGVGRWSSGESRWTVHTLNILPDGRRASATNIYDVVDDNTVRFRSIGRQVDGELLPNIEPVTVVRAVDQ